MISIGVIFIWVISIRMIFVGMIIIGIMSNGIIFIWMISLVPDPLYKVRGPNTDPQESRNNRNSLWAGTPLGSPETCLDTQRPLRGFQNCWCALRVFSPFQSNRPAIPASHSHSGPSSHSLNTDKLSVCVFERERDVCVSWRVREIEREI